MFSKYFYEEHLSFLNRYNTLLYKYCCQYCFILHCQIITIFEGKFCVTSETNPSIEPYLLHVTNPTVRKNSLWMYQEVDTQSNWKTKVSMI